MRRNPLPVPQSQAGPQYRFWGSKKPPESREPVRAQLSSSGEESDAVATLRVYGPIDSWGGSWGVSATEMAAALDELPDTVKSIDLHLNSPGGEVYEGIAILNLLRQHDATVTAYVDGLAASAASFIAAGVDQTVMGENSQLMIHDAWGIVVGPASDMHQMGNLLDKISGNIASVYQGKAGGTPADWRSAMLAETWYDAEEAVNAGLADRVAGPVDEAAQDAFDLSMFKHEGRDDAPPPPVGNEGGEGVELSAAARARRLVLAKRTA